MVERQSLFGSTPRERFFRRWAGVSVAAVVLALLLFRFPTLTNAIVLGMLYGLGIPASYVVELRRPAPTLPRLVGRHAMIGFVVGWGLLAAISIVQQVSVFDAGALVLNLIIATISAVVGSICGMIAAIAAVKLPGRSVVAVAIVCTAGVAVGVLPGWWDTQLM